MKNNKAGGGRICRPLAILLRNAVFLSFALASSLASQTFDVLIIEKPDHLVVDDAFQQSVASPDATIFQPFAPIKILKSRDVLGDGLTPCAKVEVDGETFYVIRNDRGQLLGTGKLGVIRVFRNARFVEDTIEVLANKTISLQDPIGSGRRFLPPGQRCIRYFVAGGLVYVRVTATTPEYGWLRLPAAGIGHTWRVVHSEVSLVVLSPMIRDRVTGKIAEVNRAYKEIYSLLNQESRRAIPPPQWGITSSYAGMVCTLQPAAAANYYPQSIQSLSATLQTYLLGSGYGVTVQRNSIIIRKQ